MAQREKKFTETVPEKAQTLLERKTDLLDKDLNQLS